MEYRVRRFFLQISGRNAKIIRFTCSIDISQYDVICKGKSFGKFRKKGFGTCISMRLEYTPDLLMWIIFGCVKGGFNLCRMMRIIITMVMPPASPTRSKRRRTPAKSFNASTAAATSNSRAHMSVSTPAALSALWRPGFCLIWQLYELPSGKVISNEVARPWIW